MVWQLDVLTVHMYGCLFGTEVKHGVAVRYAYCTHVWLSIWYGGGAWCGSWICLLYTCMVVYLVRR